MNAPSALSAQACPCGSGLGYARCCGAWHTGPTRLQAPSPQALMCSRYSAHVLGLVDYLLETWHPSTRPQTLELEPALKWLGLEVKRELLESPTQGQVEFVARSKLAGRAHRLHETSRFVREAGQWFYVDGVIR